jgi:hypothetical protein
MRRLQLHVGFLPIVLQKSKVAAVQIFGENLKRKEVDDSHSLSRAAEVADEFVARRRGPSDHYTNNAPAALRNFAFPAKRLLQHYRHLADMFEKLGDVCSRDRSGHACGAR